MIFLFTHPMMELLIRTRFFGLGHKLSGLDPEHLGATSSTYGKGREAVADRVAGSLARRKAEARRAAENPDEVTADDADDSDDTHDAVDEAAEQGEVDAIDVAADGGKDGKTK